ncbi:MAG: hypothetical protein HY433_00780 [Candidatus Liptonbacteria bacterium]|nr:hypothetical protein [Candidatus Liptonbacteria bacterium]
MEGKNREKTGKIDERNEILGIYGEIAAMGGNDFELDAIEGILLNLEKGKCPPEEALRQVREIRDRKNSYH